MRLTITFVITSFSSGLLSAIIKVSAKRVVANSFTAILSVEDPIGVKEPEKERGCNALIAIHKKMILHNNPVL